MEWVVQTTLVVRSKIDADNESEALDKAMAKVHSVLPSASLRNFIVEPVIERRTVCEGGE